MVMNILFCEVKERSYELDRGVDSVTDEQSLMVRLVGLVGSLVYHLNSHQAE